MSLSVCNVSCPGRQAGSRSHRRVVRSSTGYLNACYCRLPAGLTDKASRLSGPGVEVWSRRRASCKAAMACAAAERKAIRVLLVEDEEIHRVLARALLRSAVGGVELDEARTGAEAVRRVRDGGAAGAYDLIITDGKMPVMDGREIRAMGVTTPIVGLSSDTFPSDVDAFLKAGADDFTPKPLSKEKLVRILAKFNLA
ncbi:hypothetical protein SORBI_3001G095100 [Sorghum bicolor]|uniref:Response regulatory domain-containing protein n=1 Tax=Sorghum bicolor TaxID=4558 RepID=A0A1Z5S5I6_SORBI|nr:hypothetical protein SORBI_3001G095100 [Sorghum bicolor]